MSSTYSKSKDRSETIAYRKIGNEIARLNASIQKLSAELEAVRVRLTALETS